MYVYVCVCMCVCLCMCAFVCGKMFVCMCVHAHAREPVYVTVQRSQELHISVVGNERLKPSGLTSIYREDPGENKLHTENPGSRESGS